VRDRKERDEEKSVGTEEGSTPGTQDHRIVEPLALRPCLTRVS